MTTPIKLHLSPIGDGHHVKVWRTAQASDKLPSALGAGADVLPVTTHDGLALAAVAGWQTLHRVAHVFVLVAAPALARHLEACESAALRGELAPEPSLWALGEEATLVACFPGLASQCRFR